MKTLVIHETVSQAYEASGGPKFMRPTAHHVSLGSVVTGGPYEDVVYTHGAVMAICEDARLWAWARDSVASRVTP